MINDIHSYISIHTYLLFEFGREQRKRRRVLSHLKFEKTDLTLNFKQYNTNLLSTLNTSSYSHLFWPECIYPPPPLVKRFGGHQIQKVLKNSILQKHFKRLQNFAKLSNNSLTLIGKRLFFSADLSAESFSVKEISAYNLKSFVHIFDHL